jgi:hypothetical protein
MINWTCLACGRTLSTRIAIAPPVHCSCGHIDRDPQLVHRADPPPKAVIDHEQAAAVQAELERRKAEDGRRAWAALHRYPADHWSTWDPAAAERWYREEWLLMVPRYCDCVGHWLQLVERHPPCFASAREFAAWTVERHSDVSERLGRPRWSFGQAAAAWGY